jgi:hypothetical protein
MSGNLRSSSVNKSNLYSKVLNMVMAKKGKGDKNNVRYFMFYYLSVLTSHNDNTCPRTSMSNLNRNDPPLGDRSYSSHVAYALFVLSVLPRGGARAISARGGIATGAVLNQARASDYLLPRSSSNISRQSDSK